MKVKSESEIAQSCLTLSDPMDCSLPGSSIHGIFQATVLEWGAIAFSNEYCYSIIFGVWSPFTWKLFIASLPSAKLRDLIFDDLPEISHGKIILTTETDELKS